MANEQKGEPLLLEKRTEIALEALKRNDEIIRYSESKTGFLIGYISILLGLLADKLMPLKASLLSSHPVMIILVAIAASLIAMGMLIALISAIQVVYPRLRVTPRQSFMYFGSIINENEKDFVARYKRLSAINLDEQILSQVHATSIIASQKFKHVNRMIVGVVIYSIGWFITLAISFILL